ncbi:unnamed protein product [marine sediment metagenome]|uniref:Uncharacterized protein n=1 Tax=marine sediment metagenome TaxID=412755 RepID=X1GVJ0_9ZZZZ
MRNPSKYNGIPPPNPNMKCPSCSSYQVVLRPYEYSDKVESSRGNGHCYGAERKSRVAYCQDCGYEGLVNGPDGFLKNFPHQSDSMIEQTGNPDYDEPEIWVKKVNPCLGQK